MSVDPDSTMSHIRWEPSISSWIVSHVSALSGNQYIKTFAASDYGGKESALETAHSLVTYMQMWDMRGILEKHEYPLGPKEDGIVVIQKRE